MLIVFRLLHDKVSVASCDHLIADTNCKHWPRQGSSVKATQCGRHLKLSKSFSLQPRVIFFFISFDYFISKVKWFSLSPINKTVFCKNH